MNKVEDLIKNVFNIPNLVDSTTTIAKEIIAELEVLVSKGDAVATMAFITDISNALNLLVGATFASTPEATLIAPEVAQTVASIEAAPEVVAPEVVAKKPA